MSVCQHVSKSLEILNFIQADHLDRLFAGYLSAPFSGLQRPFAYQALGHAFCNVNGQPMYLAWELDTKADQSRPYCVAVELGRSSTD